MPFDRLPRVRASQWTRLNMSGWGVLLYRHTILWTDTYDWKHYLAATFLAGGKYLISFVGLKIVMLSQIVITFIIPSNYRPQGRVMFSEACVSHSVHGGMISFPVWSHVLLGGGIVSHPVWYHVPSGGVCSQGIFSKGGGISAPWGWVTYP